MGAPRLDGTDVCENSGTAGELVASEIRRPPADSCRHATKAPEVGSGPSSRTAGVGSTGGSVPVAPLARLPRELANTNTHFSDHPNGLAPRP
jgi:hypothetical protein